MRMDQFTLKAQEAIAAAQTQAEKGDHPEVTRVGACHLAFD